MFDAVSFSVAEKRTIQTGSETTYALVMAAGRSGRGAVEPWSRGVAILSHSFRLEVFPRSIYVFPSLACFPCDWTLLFVIAIARLAVWPFQSCFLCFFLGR